MSSVLWNTFLRIPKLATVQNIPLYFAPDSSKLKWGQQNKKMTRHFDCEGLQYFPSFFFYSTFFSNAVIQLYVCSPFVVCFCCALENTLENIVFWMTVLWPPAVSWMESHFHVAAGLWPPVPIRLYPAFISFLSLTFGFLVHFIWFFFGSSVLWENERERKHFSFLCNFFTHGRQMRGPKLMIWVIYLQKKNQQF